MLLIWAVSNHPSSSSFIQSGHFVPQWSTPPHLFLLQLWFMVTIKAKYCNSLQVYFAPGMLRLPPFLLLEVSLTTSKAVDFWRAASTSRPIAALHRRVGEWRSPLLLGSGIIPFSRQVDDDQSVAVAVPMQLLGAMNESWMYSSASQLTWVKQGRLLRCKSLLALIFRINQKNIFFFFFTLLFSPLITLI